MHSKSDVSMSLSGTRQADDSEKRLKKYFATNVWYKVHLFISFTFEVHTNLSVTAFHSEHTLITIFTFTTLIVY